MYTLHASPQPQPNPKLPPLLPIASLNAAESLLMVALSPSFPQPYPIVRVVGSFCDLLSPVTLTLIYSSLYQHRLRFPLGKTRSV